MDNSQLEAARTVAFRFLGYSARSVAQVERRLQKAGFEEPVISAVIEDLSDRGYLDDQKFCSDWISDRADRKRYGKARLSAELHRTGVDAGLIKAAVTAIDHEAERVRAMDAAEAKFPVCACHGMTGQELAAQNVRVAAFLQRRGFDWSVIKQVLTDRKENSN